MLALVSLLMAGTSCTKKINSVPGVAQPLVGYWLFDAEATLREFEEDDRAEAASFLNAMQVGLEFTYAGAITMSVGMLGENVVQTGTYEILSTDADGVTLRMSMPANIQTGEPASVDDMRVTFSGSDRMRFAPLTAQSEESSSEAIVLVRSTAAAVEAAVRAPATVDQLQELYDEARNTEKDRIGIAPPPDRTADEPTAD